MSCHDIVRRGKGGREDTDPKFNARYCPPGSNEKDALSLLQSDEGDELVSGKYLKETLKSSAKLKKYLKSNLEKKYIETVRFNCDNTQSFCIACDHV